MRNLLKLLKLRKGSSIKYVRKIFQKTNISNPLIRIRTCAYQGVINISFLENFVYVLNEWFKMETGAMLRSFSENLKLFEFSKDLENF